MGRMLTAIAIVTLGFTFAHPAEAEETAAELVQRAWGNFRSVGSERERVEFLIIAKPKPEAFSMDDARTLTDDKGGVVRKRAVRQTIFAQDGQDKIHLLFSAPPDDAGTGFLIWRMPGAAQDSQWVFVPGMAHARRVAASSTQSFMGTDFIYEDIREFAGERTERFDYRFAGKEALGDHTCTIVEATPKPDTTTAYRRRKTWFADDTLLPLKVEYYGPDDKLRKVLRTDAIEKVGTSAYRANFAELRDHQLDEVTLMLLSDRQVGISIPERRFTQDYLLRPDSE